MKKVITVTLNPAIDKVIRLDKLAPNEVNRVQISMLYCGGKGNNVARALSRLGLPVVATGFQGGHTGVFASEQLAKEGIQTSFVMCQRPTRTSTLVHEEATGATYALYEPGFWVEPEEIDQLLERFTAWLDEAALCLFCGTGHTELLAGVYARMIEIARQKGVRSLLDSSGSALAAGIQACPSVLKVNKHELAECVGAPMDEFPDQVAAMRRLQAAGTGIVALSLGKDGMVATDGVDFWHAYLHVDNVINVVGCGDSLLAGMAKALLQDAPLEEVLRWGVACGTANTQVEGAGYIELATVQSFLPRVIIKKATL